MCEVVHIGLMNKYWINELKIPNCHRKRPHTQSSDIMA